MACRMMIAAAGLILSACTAPQGVTVAAFDCDGILLDMQDASLAGMSATSRAEAIDALAQWNTLDRQYANHCV